MNVDHTVPPGTVMPTDDTPRLTDLVATLIGRRGAQDLLMEHGEAGLRTLTAEEIASVAGVEPMTAERLVAARLLGEHLYVRSDTRIRTDLDALDALPAFLRTAETEFLLAMALAGDLTLKATVLVAAGGAAQASVTLADVFCPMLRLRAKAFILVHNHPSGDPTPSHDDVVFTNRVARGALLVGVKLTDHIVVARCGSVSMHETGLLPTMDDLWDGGAL